MKDGVCQGTAIKRTAIAPKSANGKSTNRDARTPVTTIQTNETPRARRKAIQGNKASADPRRGRLARIEALRTELRLLVDAVSHAIDVELLDLMAGGESGCYERHKTAEKARTWAEAAGITLETGLMQLTRAACPYDAPPSHRKQGGATA